MFLFKGWNKIVEQKLKFSDWFFVGSGLVCCACFSCSWIALLMETTKTWILHHVKAAESNNSSSHPIMPVSTASSKSYFHGFVTGMHAKQLQIPHPWTLWNKSHAPLMMFRQSQSLVVQLLMTLSKQEWLGNQQWAPWHQQCPIAPALGTCRPSEGDQTTCGDQTQFTAPCFSCRPHNDFQVAGSARSRQKYSKYFQLNNIIF